VPSFRKNSPANLFKLAFLGWLGFYSTINVLILWLNDWALALAQNLASLVLSTLTVALSMKLVYALGKKRSCTTDDSCSSS